jgi:DNA polymerase III subunit epsilon
MTTGQETLMPTDKIAVIDLETTGLSPWRNDRIVEIAIVIMSPDGTILEEYETLVNPNRDLGPTGIHRISAGEIIHAPTFADIAGDVLDLLKPSFVIAGHNVRFDKNFLVTEYRRIGVTIPEFPLLCTCNLLGRSSLAACCEEFGISIEGELHRALTDARATARLLSVMYKDNPSLIDPVRQMPVEWPMMTSKKSRCYPREAAKLTSCEPPRFLQRLSGRIRHETQADSSEFVAYLTLIDRILEDRIIDEREEMVLVDAVSNWKLSDEQLRSAHQQYLQNLVVIALADGVISDQERQDLHTVARLLGEDETKLDSLIEGAAAQFATANLTNSVRSDPGELQGKRVCFTGELQSQIGGNPITRGMAEVLAASAGLIVCGSVTRKLDILVVADPNTLSGKAKKARELGIRVVADTVFWRMIGVRID